MKGTTIFTMTALCAALVCCSKEETSTPPAPEGGIVLTFAADSKPEAYASSQSRTVLGDGGKVYWINNKDQLRLFETADGKTVAKTTWQGVTSESNKSTGDPVDKVTFRVGLDVRTASTPFVYHAVYPNTSAASTVMDLAAYPVWVLCAQTPTATSFDSAADRLISKPVEFEMQPTNTTSSNPLKLSFLRPIAVGELKIKDLQTSDPIQTVKFSAPGKALAGLCTIDLNSGAITGMLSTSDELVLNGSALAAAEDGTIPVHFTCLPFELNAGDTFVLTVSTASAVFTKTVTVAAGREIRFKAGGLSSFTVNMSNIESFYAESVSLNGSATGNVETPVEKTVENENQYAWCGGLTAGILTIPVKSGGNIRYIVPADNSNAALGTGEIVAAKMSQTAASWTVPDGGVCRLVIDLEKCEVRGYSSENDLKPLTVKFYPNGDISKPEAEIEVNDLYLYGSKSWSGIKLNCSQSLADPQILVYNGTQKLKDRTSFRVSQNFTAGGTSFGISNTYGFTCPLTSTGESQDVPLILNQKCPLHGGSGKERSSYYNISPEAAYLIVFDLRNGTILVRNK